MSRHTMSLCDCSSYVCPSDLTDPSLVERELKSTSGASNLDAQRFADKNSMIASLQAYYLAHGSFPSSSAGWRCLTDNPAETCWANGYSGWASLIRDRAPVRKGSGWGTRVEPGGRRTRNARGVQALRRGGTQTTGRGRMDKLMRFPTSARTHVWLARIVPSARVTGRPWSRQRAL